MYQEHIRTVPPKDQKSAFAFRVAQTRLMFDMETDEVKQEVEEYRRRKVSDMTVKINDADAQDESSQVEMAMEMQS
jgi:hypothetical protein